ncbi:MAG TPA: copper chaperone PCu(A)C [Thermaerobacter sp.]
MRVGLALRRLLLAASSGLAILAAAACGGGGTGGAPGAGATIGDLTVRDLRAPAPAGDTMAVYFTVANSGEVDDALVGLASDVAVLAMLHRTVMEDGTARMAMVDAIPVPAGGEAVLEPGGLHVMLAGLRREPREGETVLVTLTFQRAGTVTVEVPVVSYREVADGDSGP